MKLSQLKNIIKEELKFLKENNPKALQPLNEGWVYYCNCPGHSRICSRPCEGCAQGCKPYGPGEFEMTVGLDGRITPGQKGNDNPVMDR